MAAIYSAIGIDITFDRIKLLQLKWQKNSLSIQAASQIKLTNTQDKKGLIEALRKLLAGTKIKGMAAVVALPNHLITTIPIKFTLKEDEEIEQAIIREANNYLPFPLDKGVIDYLSLPSPDQKSPKTALLIASKREDIISYLDLLKQTNLEANAIEPRYCSIFRTIRWANQGKSLHDQFIFYMEENNTMIMVLVDEQILVVREIPWGINKVRIKIKKTLDLSGESADKILRQYGLELKENQRQGQTAFLVKGGELRQVIYEVISPIFEELCQEIQKVLSYCVSIVQQRVINQALMLGEGAQIRALDHFIHQRTGIKVRLWEGEKLTGSHTFFETALGLALRDPPKKMDSGI